MCPFAKDMVSDCQAAQSGKSITTTTTKKGEMVFTVVTKVIKDITKLKKTSGDKDHTIKICNKTIVTVSYEVYTL